MKLKRTILSLVMSCIYMLATFGTVLFDTCAACCNAHDHAAACERCCHCGHEGRSNDGSPHFDCNCSCHLHSHDTSEESIVAVSQGRDDLIKKLLKKSPSESGAYFVLPSEAAELSSREGSRISFGGDSVWAPLCPRAAAGLRAPPVIS